MLGWITRQNGDVAGSADDSKVLEPPETPAPVFAIRAFKSALFGTPGADEDGERTVQQKYRAADQQRSKSDIPKLTTDKQGNGALGKKSDNETATQAMASPTKSILLTPGTTSNRRKTVSFGDSVLENERKKDEALAKASKTQSTSLGNVSSQWMSGQPEGKNKGRSKLTQSLLDARENPSDDLPKVVEPVKPEQSPAKEAEATPTTKSRTESNDETVDLNEPRSQSGQYWKAEFESYRMKTNREIKKLIQYRSVAKSYARKKDAEALRLADKLKEEEAKVAEMERHVSNLASTMVGGGIDSDKEKLVQELAKQTALALQYKHKVNTLRKVLEKHGVVGSDLEQPESDTTSERTAEELRKTQQELEQANAKIEEMKQQQSELTKFQDLAQNFERKVSDLEKENSQLKQSLARVKQEMTKYEGRRKEKEAKLKQREAKLEARNHEYRERLKTAAQERREAEEALRQSFQEERRRMQKQIEELRNKIPASERGNYRSYAYNRQGDHADVQVYDFALHQQGRSRTNQTEILEEPGSPSPQSKPRHSRQSRVTTSAARDSRRVSRTGAVDINRDEEPLIYLEDSPHKDSDRRSHLKPGKSTSAVPPSSPPQLPTIEPPTAISPEKPKHEQRGRRTYESPRPTMISFPECTQRSQTCRAQQHNQPTKISSEISQAQRRSGAGASALFDLGTEHILLSHDRRETARRSGLSPDRLAAAKARLKQREENRKSLGKEDGKENIKAYIT
ncbi:hypothetical protein VTN00DRAFT_6209 [Thermoascus crustaceus]|uniref:uncharacterized protein n=1 Tax=Thermoascus crustaceus TaxID=5088 RepID=UPI003743C714